MPAIEAVLFDFDGVLVDSEPVHFRCWRELTAPFGIEIDWETYSKAYIGVATRQMLQDFCDRTANGTTLDQLLALLPRKRAMFNEIVCRELPFAQEYRELLDALAGYKLAVVTSSNRIEVEPVLAAAGIRDRFAALVCGSDVSRQKPAPDPYLKAAELLGITRALVVEDSDPGVESALAAGFEVVQVDGPGEVWPLLKARLAHNCR